LQLETLFVPNERVQAADKFSGKDSYEKTSTFGMRRVK
jgi:hypothetical protein